MWPKWAEITIYSRNWDVKKVPFWISVFRYVLFLLVSRPFNLVPLWIKEEAGRETETYCCSVQRLYQIHKFKLCSPVVSSACSQCKDSQAQGQNEILTFELCRLSRSPKAESNSLQLMVQIEKNILLIWILYPSGEILLASLEHSYQLEGVITVFVRSSTVAALPLATLSGLTCCACWW